MPTAARQWRDWLGVPHPFKGCAAALASCGTLWPTEVVGGSSAPLGLRTRLPGFKALALPFSNSGTLKWVIAAYNACFLVYKRSVIMMVIMPTQGVVMRIKWDDNGEVLTYNGSGHLVSATVCLLNEMRQVPSPLISFSPWGLLHNWKGDYRICSAIFLEAATVSSRQTNLLLGSWQKKRRERFLPHHMGETRAGQVGTLVGPLQPS